MTAAEQERLAYLSEELGEAVQAVGKVLRHGFETSHRDYRKLLEKELGHVLSCLDLLDHARDISVDRVHRWQKKKTDKRKRFHAQGDR